MIFCKICAAVLLFFPVWTWASKKTASEYFALADRAILAKEYDTAVNHYLKGLQYAYQKEKTTVWDDLGFAYLQKKQMEKADEYLNSALEAFPENFNLRLYLALSHLWKQDWPAARADLEVIERSIYFTAEWMQPAADAPLYNRYGEKIERADWEGLSLEKGVYIRSAHQENYLPRRTIHLDAFDEKNQGAFLFSLGLTLWHQGESNKAQIKWMEAEAAGFPTSEILLCKQSPESYNLSNLLELTHHRLRDNQNGLLYQEMERFFQELKAGEIDSALRRLELALLIDEQSIDLNRNLALLYFDRARREELPDDRMLKAEALAVRAKWFNHFRNAAKDERIGCLTLLGNIYFFQQKYQPAVRQFSEILSLDKENLVALYNLGSCFLHLGEPESAIGSWQKALEIGLPKEVTPTQAAQKNSHDLTVKYPVVVYLCLNALGDLLMTRDQLDEAQAHLEQATALQPNQPLPHLRLAILYDRKNLREKALHHLQRYIDLGGELNDEIRELKKKLQND